MRQIAQNYKTGEIKLVEVPVPACREGGVVVRSEYSLVSAGTELTKVAESKMSLLGKARARPDQVKRVLETASQQGVAATYRKVMNRLDSYTPLGYSVSGTVVESMVDELPVGTRVACGGNEYAFHAEYNFVPSNLCVQVPDGVKGEHAAFGTVGAIAMQAFRRSDVRIGEVVCVIGLGLIGQLLVQIANSAGVHAVGLDPSEERCVLAERLGARAAGAPSGGTLERVRSRIAMLSEGHGADVVFLAAATDSREPVQMAVDLARDKARIVDVGRLPLDLPWKPYYEKEIDVLFSRSYGPGRYDPSYEEEGIDYPIGYVRWTERRNMRSFLDLIAEERVDLDPLIEEVVPFDSAVEAYERLHAGESTAIGSLFAYGTDTTLERVVIGASGSPVPTSGAVRVGVIGSGNYATTMLLPHLSDNRDASLVSVATATALSGATAQERFAFEKVTTDYHSVLEDRDIDAVVVATRHDLHATIVREALQAGKAVFVEKPLAITEDELEEVIEAIGSSGNQRLMVGFNRRFAPLLRELKDMWGEVASGSRLHYTVNTGPLGDDSWYRNVEKYGSRFVGEGGHFIDVCSWWLGEDPEGVAAHATGEDVDDIVVILRYPGGSVASISYLTGGSSRYPKETLVVSGSGRNARLDNFRRIEVWTDRGKTNTRRLRGTVDKGQAAEIQEFVSAVKSGGDMPIEVNSLIATTRATLLAQVSARSGRIEPLNRQVEA